MTTHRGEDNAPKFDVFWLFLCPALSKNKLVTELVKFFIIYLESIEVSL